MADGVRTKFRAMLEKIEKIVKFWIFGWKVCEEKEEK